MKSIIFGVSSNKIYNFILKILLDQKYNLNDQPKLRLRFKAGLKNKHNRAKNSKVFLCGHVVIISPLMRIRIFVFKI